MYMCISLHVHEYIKSMNTHVTKTIYTYVKYSKIYSVYYFIT